MIKYLIFFGLCLPVSSVAQSSYPYRQLALEGGGIRGIAFAGVFEVLEQKKILPQIQKVAGSSAGAIAGMMLCLGYNAGEIDSMLVELRIQQFNDGGGGALGKYKRIKSNYGIYKGNRFEKWLQQLVANKTGNPLLSFEDLHLLTRANPIMKDLYVTGTNLSKQRLQIFSYEHSPHLPIALAVRISSSIPFYFEPIALNNQFQRITSPDEYTGDVNFYVDGGLLCNYPIGMFDTCHSKESPLECLDAGLNPSTLGIKLERAAQIDSLNHNSTAIPPYNPQNLKEYVSAFSNLLIEALNRKHPQLANERGRTIYVSYGNIEPKPRRMKPEEKKLLYDNGVKAALQFFKNDGATTWSQTPSAK